MISKSSVCHLHTQLRTDAEKPRDQIIRSKNSLLVKLKLTCKKQVRTYHQMVQGFHTDMQTEGFSPEQRRLRRPFRFLFRLQAGGTAEPTLSTSTQPTKYINKKICQRLIDETTNRDIEVTGRYPSGTNSLGEIY